MADEKISKKRVAFSLRTEASSVLLAGDFTEWEAAALPLVKQKNGTWKVTASLAPGRYEYRFIVDGNWVDDPACTERVSNCFGVENCVRVVA